MFFATYLQARNTILSLFEGKELPCEIDTFFALFLLVLRSPAKFFEEVSIGSIPVGYAVTKEHARAVK